MSDFAYRGAVVEDVPFIADSWLESFRVSHSAGPIPMDMYFGVYREVVARMLSRQDARCIVACNPANEGQIFAYLVYEPGTVLYAFTKQAFRRLGILNAMLAQAGFTREQTFTYAFKTPAAAAITRSHWRNARFDPLSVRFNKKKES